MVERPSSAPRTRRERALDVEVAVYGVVVGFVVDHRYAPSRRDIAEETGHTVAVVNRALRDLRDAGWVEWIPYQARTLRVCD